MILTKIHRNILFAVLILCVLGASCKKAPAPSETRKVLGSYVTVTIYDEGQTTESLDRAFDKVFEELSWWERKTVVSGPENDLDKIAASSGTQSITVDTSVYEMLMKALRLQDSSGELFDVRYGPMVDAWGFESTPRVPEQAVLDSARTLVRDGGMFVAGKSILLAKKGMRFNVREFIEGYAIDQAAESLKSRGFQNFMINSDRVWKVEGTAPNAKGFEINIPNFDQPEMLWAKLYVKSGGVALMNTNRNRFDSGGKSYHALLDPRTGWPAVTHAGTIVHAADAATAQAHAYAMFVAGEADRIPDLGRGQITGSVIINGTPGNYSLKRADR